MNRFGRIRAHRQRGEAMIEWMIVFLLLTCGASMGLAPLGRCLLAYYDRVEWVTALPLP